MVLVSVTDEEETVETAPLLPNPVDGMGVRYVIHDACPRNFQVSIRSVFDSSICVTERNECRAPGQICSHRTSSCFILSVVVLGMMLQQSLCVRGRCTCRPEQEAFPSARDCHVLMVLARSSQSVTVSWGHISWARGSGRMASAVPVFRLVRPGICLVDLTTWKGEFGPLWGRCLCPVLTSVLYQLRNLFLSSGTV